MLPSLHHIRNQECSRAGTRGNGVPVNVCRIAGTLVLEHCRKFCELWIGWVPYAKIFRFSLGKRQILCMSPKIHHIKTFCASTAKLHRTKITINFEVIVQFLPQDAVATCLSACLSHAGIVSKQIKVSSNLFLGLVAHHSSFPSPHMVAKFEREGEPVTRVDYLSLKTLNNWQCSKINDP